MTPHNFDIVCVGNAKIDTFLTLHEATHNLRFLKETNELCIKFGEKITVDKAEILLGGNAANVSVGLSRLGLMTTLVAEIGKDEFAQKIINTLSKEKVDTSNIKQTEGQQSSFSTIINFKGERTILSEHVKRSHDFNFESVSTKWIYLTSLGDDWHNAYEKTLNFVKKTKCHLAFNPGTLQLAAGYNSIAKAISLTDILFVNKEEAGEMLYSERGVTRQEGLPTPRSEFFRKENSERAVAGGKPATGPRQESVKEIMIALQKLGPKIVVITDGENGSYAIDEKGEILKEGIVETKVLEKTGAGDAYSSGFVAAFLYNKSIADAMNWGAKNSASVIGKVGAQAGLLYV